VSGFSGGWDVSGAGIAPLTISGNYLQAPAAGGLDAQAASGALNIGTVNAGTITIGRTNQALNLGGFLQLFTGNNIDTQASGALAIGGFNATTITIGRAGQSIQTKGTLQITPGQDIDTTAAGIFSIGGVNATQITFNPITAFGVAEAAPGGGASATLPTIGGTGPATAAAHGWLPIKMGATASWIPVWR
jgi:hypothetical protein